MLFFECETSNVGLHASDLAGVLIADILSRGGLSPTSDGFDLSQRVRKLVSFAKAHGLLADQRHLMKEARVSGFPAKHIGDKWLQLGHGRYGRMLWGTITDKTPWSAVELSTDKAYTNQKLRGLGLLVPAQQVVRTRKQVCKAAHAIGYPVAVKPNRQDRQVGISIDIQNDSDLVTAFDNAVKYGSDVLIEEMLTGMNYRVLVFDGAIISALAREHAHVVGDGENTIAALVDRANHDPRRGLVNDTPLFTIELNAEAEANLVALGYSKDTVPDDGEHVILRYFPSISRGGTAQDVTDDIHPEVCEAMLLGGIILAVGLKINGMLQREQ